MRHESIVEAIGHTPLVRLRVPAPEGVEVYAKLELANNFAMKDRVARQVVTEARRSGALKPGAPIVESSSGTMALGLALVGTHLGHPVHIVTDPRIDPITLAKLRTLGCEVHVVSAMGEQGWQSARLDLLAELMTGLPGAFWPQLAQGSSDQCYRKRSDYLGKDVFLGKCVPSICTHCMRDTPVDSGCPRAARPAGKGSIQKCRRTKTCPYQSSRTLSPGLSAWTSRACAPSP